MAENKQLTLGDMADQYEAEQTFNVADLDRVPLNAPIEIVEAQDKDGKPFSYYALNMNGHKFRVPNGVLADIKTLRQNKPKAKAIKVVKKGTGMQTRYTVLEVE